MKSGIYCIERIETGQKYVGKSVSIIGRMNQQHKGCKLIHSAILFYGKENFLRYVLEYCPNDKNILNEREKYWIKELHSHVSENGYNLSWGGDDFRSGLAVLEIVKKKISDTLMGHNVSDDTKKKISDARMGMEFSDEHKENLSKSHSGEKSYWYGKSIPLETKQKMSESQQGEKSYWFAKKRKNTTSMFYGVFKDVHDGGKYIYWVYQITLNSKLIKLGTKKTEIEAAKAYDEYIIENNLHPPYPLNFPDDYILYP